MSHTDISKLKASQRGEIAKEFLDSIPLAFQDLVTDAIVNTANYYEAMLYFDERIGDHLLFHEAWTQEALDECN